MTAEPGAGPLRVLALFRRYVMHAVVTAAVVVAPGCAHRPMPLYEAERAVADYIDSGMYLRDVEAVVAEARIHIATRAESGAKNLAVVLDIDETALSNWPAYKLNNYSRILHGPCDLHDGPCGIFAYQALGVSPGIEPTLELVRAANRLGLKVYFLSGRSERMRATTARNLREAGFRFDGLILHPDGEAKLTSAARFKAAERARLAAGGLRIVLCMGDQLSDLTGGHCERAFKLPNPVYYLP
ncbi:MAG: hypothetical protein NFCOHLIN_02665 [Gammaproteobacteria bacterium]|nr:hypothetical protein [Gammaproteobacteria bacterium]